MSGFPLLLDSLFTKNIDPPSCTSRIDFCLPSFRPPGKLATTSSPAELAARVLGVFPCPLRLVANLPQGQEVGVSLGFPTTIPFFPRRPFSWDHPSLAATPGSAGPTATTTRPSSSPPPPWGAHVHMTTNNLCAPRSLIPPFVEVLVSNWQDGRAPPRIAQPSCEFLRIVRVFLSMQRRVGRGGLETLG